MNQYQVQNQNNQNCLISQDEQNKHFQNIPKEKDSQLEKDCYILKQSLRMREKTHKLIPKLSKFITSNPSQKSIKQIAESIKFIMKQSSRYKQVIDNMTIIFKYLYKTSKSRKVLTEEQLQNFNEKLDIILKFTKNQDIYKWIQQIQESQEHMINRLHLQIKKYKDIQEVYEQLLKKQRENAFEMTCRIENLSNIMNRYRFQYYQFNKEATLEEKLTKIIQENDQFHLKIQQKTAEGSLCDSEYLKIILMQCNIQGSTFQDQMLNLNKYILNEKSKLKISTDTIEIINQIGQKKQGQIAELKVKEEDLHKLAGKYWGQIQKMKVQIIKNASNILETQQAQKISKIQRWLERNDLKNEIGNHQKYLRAKMLFSSQYIFNNKIFQIMSNEQKIMILVKLKNQIIVGAYSEQNFEDDCYGENGFLFNFTKEQIFERSKNSKVINDKSCIVLGNKEFCLKPKQMKFFTNLGLKNGHFKGKEKSYEDFLDLRNTQQVDILEFQIYRIDYF